MIKKLGMISILTAALFAGVIEEGIAQAKKGHNQEALALFEQACNEENLAQGCYYSAQAYGKGTVVAKDTQKSLDYYQKSCDLGYSNACMVVGSAYYYGFGIKKDYTKAEKILTQACNAGDANGCFLVGSMYDLGQGVQRNTQKALKLYTNACKYGSKKGCEYQKQMEQ